jgi:hypothetical protein
VVLRLAVVDIFRFVSDSAFLGADFFWDALFIEAERRRTHGQRQA